MARDDAASTANRARVDASMVCVDFDLTVLARHSFAERVTVERVERLDAADVEREFVDVQSFRRLLSYATARGMDVKIASFGEYEVIQAYVDRALGRGAMTRADISTPSRVGAKDGCAVEGGKKRQIEERLRETHGDEAWKKFRDTVVLFDDDERNVEAAIRAGFRAAHTPDGLTRAAIQSVFGDFD